MNLIKELNKFEDFLGKNGLSESTINSYRNCVRSFLAWLELATILVSEVNTEVVVNYIQSLEGNKPITVNAKLKKLDEWYIFLQRRKIVKENPFFNERVNRVQRTKVGKNSLTKERVEEIFEAIPDENYYGSRNKCMLSLLFFQGLTFGQIQRLKISDLNLIEGEIKIVKTKRINGRLLELNKTQRRLFLQYVNSSRPILFRKYPKADENLLFNYKNSSIMNSGVYWLMKNLRKQFPDLINMEQIRASVIKHLVKESRTILEAKEKMGMKYLSSIEPYDDQKWDTLKAKIEKAISLKF